MAALLTAAVSRLYTVDAGHPEESFRVIDTETFVFDLT